MTHTVYSMRTVLAPPLAALALAALVLVSAAQARERTNLQKLISHCQRIAAQAEMQARNADSHRTDTWFNAFAECSTSEDGL